MANALLDKLKETWPAKLAKNLLEAAMLPGDVYQGRVAVGSPEYYDRAADLAGFMTGTPGGVGGLGSGARFGIKAYHGSPYDFEKFDLSKIGTGEGAQAYGHGLYFAENPQTAQSYRDTLSGVFGPGIDSGALGSVRGSPLTNEHIAILRHFAGDQSLSSAEAAKRLQWRFPELRDPGLSGNGPAHSDLTAAVDKVRDAAKGRMYEVSINADPQQMLPWDEALSPDMAKAVRPLVDPNKLPAFDHFARVGVSGADAYKDFLGGGLYRTRPQASANLSDAGIPGIRYLDQGSRGLDAGNGTSNYVVFDPGIIDILRKYGWLLPTAPVAAQGANMLMQQGGQDNL